MNRLGYSRPVLSSLIGVAAFAAPTLCTVPASGEVALYRAPQGEVLSTDYQVWVDGKQVDVYTARVLDPPFAGKQWDYGGPYSFANFDMAGDVKVRITSKRSLRNTMIRPVSKGVMPQIEDDHTLTIHLDRPRKLSIEPDGKKGPLLLFANPMEENPPKPEQAERRLLWPRRSQAREDRNRQRPDALPGRRRGRQRRRHGGGRQHQDLRSRDSRWLRLGMAQGTDSHGNRDPRNECRSQRDHHPRRVALDDRAAPQPPRDRAKRQALQQPRAERRRHQPVQFAGRAHHRLLHPQRRRLRGHEGARTSSGDNNNVERITVENCILWCDRARIFLLGHESRAQFMRQGDAAKSGHHPLHDDAVPVRAGRGHATRRTSPSRTSACTARASGSSSACGRSSTSTCTSKRPAPSPIFVSNNVTITGTAGRVLGAVNGRRRGARREGREPSRTSRFSVNHSRRNQKTCESAHTLTKCSLARRNHSSFGGKCSNRP